LRLRRALLIAAAVVAFLAISLETARFLTAAGGERGDVYNLLVAQARGDDAGMLKRLDGCAQDMSCQALVRANAAKFKTSGQPKILSYESPTAYSLGAKTKRARVAWEIVSLNKLPVVQCVTVTRRWSFVHGASVTLRRLSAPIGNEASC
jgi:hypothetical protein